MQGGQGCFSEITYQGLSLSESTSFPGDKRLQRACKLQILKTSLKHWVYGVCVLLWASLKNLECIVSSKGAQGDLCWLLSLTQSYPLSRLNKVGLCAISQAPNLTQSLSLPSAWGSHMHISWFLAHFLLIWHPAMHPSAAYIISISGKNVLERGMCPWAVLY